MPDRPPLLALDFDNTLSERDTIGDIVQLAAESRPPKEAKAFLATWTRAANAYHQERTRIIKQALRRPRLDAPLQERVQAFYDVLDPFERRALDAVEEAGLLAGIERGALREAGRRAPMRIGALETVARWEASGGRAAVVSANWSEDLAREAAGIADVRANTLEFDRRGVSTGRIRRRIVAAMDKRDCIRAMRAGAGRVVYAGDSLNDIPALLEADAGFLVGNKAEAELLCGALRIPVRRVDRFRADAPDSDRLYVCESATPFA